MRKYEIDERRLKTFEMTALETIVKLEKLFKIKPTLADPENYSQKLDEDSPEYLALEMAGFKVNVGIFLPKFYADTVDNMKVGVIEDCNSIPKLFLQTRLSLEKIKEVFGDYILDTTAFGGFSYHRANGEQLQFKNPGYGTVLSQAFDRERTIKMIKERMSSKFDQMVVDSQIFPNGINYEIKKEFDLFKERAEDIYQKKMDEFLSQVEQISCEFDLSKRWELKNRYRHDCWHQEYGSKISIHKNEVTIKLSSDPLDPEGLKYYLEKFKYNSEE